jgi:uncharacterized membrane protein YdjX (TVP38/TMEM64 family)
MALRRRQPSHRPLDDRQAVMVGPRGIAPASDAHRGARLSLGRIAPVVVVVVAAALVIAMGWHRQLSFETLVRHRAWLADFVAMHCATALACFMAIYVTAVSLSIPGAAFLTVTGGLLFGTLLGGSAAVISATAGATVIFLIARSAFGPFVLRRAGPRLAKLVDGFCADAFSYLLFLRLVPVFPFFLVNLAPALVGVRLPTFVAATALGAIPATFVFASVGAGLDSVIRAQAAAYHACLKAGAGDCQLDFEPGAALTPQFVCALLALAVLALAPILVKRVWPRTAAASAASGCERQEPP